MPTVYVLGGCNGAGKSTVAKDLLPDLIKVPLFVNADEIALDIPDAYRGSREIQAGRIMLHRMEEYSRQGIDFAFESTLASKTFFPFLKALRADGYSIGIVYLFLKSPELAIHRVNERARRGGHSIPEDVIRRRYERGLVNFRSLYLPLADLWFVYDNSERELTLVARGGLKIESKVYFPDIWGSVKAG
jgi:predicted ABC-type ATPase